MIDTTFMVDACLLGTDNLLRSKTFRIPFSTVHKLILSEEFTDFTVLQRSQQLVFQLEIFCQNYP